MLAHSSPIIHVNILLIAYCLVALLACDASDGFTKDGTKLRAKRCEQAGVKGEALKTCKGTEEAYKRVMAPIWAKEEREEVAIFNAALRALSARTIPRDRYEQSSLEDLNKLYPDLDSVEQSQMSKHPLFGKRFRVQGIVGYHSIDFKNEHPEGVYFYAEDASDPNNHWDMAVDIESLGRDERAFIKNQCRLIDECSGEVFGVIGVIGEGEFLQSLGMQIEYMEISPRQPQKVG